MPFPPVPDSPHPVPERQPDQQEREPRTTPDDGPSEPALAPPSGEEAEAFAKRFGEALAIVMQREDKRGTPSTVRGTNIAIQECMKIAEGEYRELSVEHIAGGNKNGDFDGEYKKERNEETPSGLRRPDFTVRHKKQDVEIDAYFNTYSALKDGSPTKLEQAAIDALAEKVGPELVQGLRKLKPEDDESEYRKLARDVCRKLFDGVRKRDKEVEKEKNKSDKRRRPDGK
jgi:hypothetical protein